MLKSSGEENAIMTAKIILNPYAGRWKGLQKREQIIAALKSIDLDFELVMTEAPNHGSQLAYRAAKDGFSPIISAGGDGSISEVMNGIVSAAQDTHTDPIPLGALPLGTANDLMVNLGIPTDFQGAIDVIAAGKTRQIDLGQVIAWDVAGKNQKIRYFDNNSAIGLEPNVTLIQQRIAWLRGTIRYIIATLIAVAKNPQWKMRLQWDGGEFTGPVSLVTAGNNPLTGGVFYMAPHADPFDGLLNCVYGYIPSRFEILRVLPRTMKAGPGNYVEHPAIHEINLTWLKIHTDQPTPLHADGEIQFEATQDIEYHILPNYLPVLMYGKSK